MLRSSRLLLIALALLAAACASGPNRRALDDALYHYAGAIRWGELDAALGFIDPEALAKRPLTALERQRFAQLQVSGYKVQASESRAKDELVQIVEIRLVNRHTQAERAIRDRQVWRWDSEKKRWWNTSGLPDFSQGAGG